MTYYQTSIANIKSLAAGIGQEITRGTAISSLTGQARKSAKCNNPLNDTIIQYRRVGQWIVELALVDFTGFRGVGKYCCGVTVFGNRDLTECIDIEQISDKLRTIRETIV